MTPHTPADPHATPLSTNLQNSSPPLPPPASSRFSVMGKRVVITGAARGIGEYTARLFAAEGAEVLVVDHPAMEEHTQKLAVSV